MKNIFIIKNYQQPIELRQGELLDYFKYFQNYSKIPKNKFILFANYRTGSTLLTDLLNCHPDIFVDGEIFNKFIKLDFKKVIFPYLYVKSQSIKVNKKVYGFDLKMHQLTNILIQKFNHKPEDYLLRLYHNNWKIIYLYRENLFNLVISSLKAIKREQWHDLGDNSFICTSVYIDCQELIKSLNYHQKNQIIEKEIMKKIPHLKIIYENNLLHSKEHQNTANIIFDYLGLQSVSVTTKMKKVSLNSVWDDVENAQEVIDFIKQTEYSIYL
ncbi:hypothetical protein [Geminocystis sp. GBBB08]|uniref:hypothetical protein n=1 Tax=Geminocystis sp. GBBB08 TaxID=2604140 RepID=UPI0027E364F1|nr:hypothetical protein [Geminocystis sp. GBBB08]MBL1211376.1 hypothetical protein [Geminocystis sp. GBBB08]